MTSVNLELTSFLKNPPLEMFRNNLPTDNFEKMEQIKLTDEKHKN
jgi:hypothetical protein